MARQKQPQVLEINPPSELKFIGPFHDVVTSHLQLSNPSDKRVAFKVKTTAPRRYCVRPNSGFIQPSGKVDVSVMLQPLEGDVSQDRGKHKFMVQSLYAPGNVEDVEKLWAESAPNDLMDSKLRCVFEGEGSAEIQSAIAASLQAGVGNQEELRSLMEECKRLQTENEDLKYQVGQSEGGGIASLKVMPQKQREIVIILAVLALIIGGAIGYLVL